MRDLAAEKMVGMTGVYLQLRGLRLEIGGKVLIDGIDLALGAQGTTVILGPNGAGKSLLLRLLHGLVPPSGGEILWQGARISPEITRRQALVFQKPVLLRRSVAANIEFALRARGIRDADAVMRLLDRVGLADKARQPARLLSGGEQQRLALARALATRPEVLLLDEPTANLDPAATLAIEDIVRDAAAQGMRAIFVTHDLGQARRMAQDVLFMHRGRIAEHVPARRFFDAPVSREARDYLAGRIVD